MFNNILFGAHKINAMHPSMARLYSYTKLLGHTQPSQLARLLNVSQQTITNWESRGISRAGLIECQRVFGVQANWLDTGEGQQESGNTSPGPDVRQFAPLISWVSAGVWSPAVDVYEPGYAEEWLPCPKNGRHTYALRVKGDSMTAPYGKTYPDGCVIFVDPDRRSPSNGDRIIAKLKGSDEVTFKAFQQDAGRTWLKPLNPQHPAIMEPFKVLGTVIGKWEDE